MKKLLVLCLSVFALASCKSNTGGIAGPEISSEGRHVETVYDIAYIQMDSLIQNYARFIDLSGAFETKATRIQNDLEARARRLESEMADAQEKVNKGLVTRSQAATLEQELGTKAQNFETERQARAAELAEEEQVYTNQVINAVMEYVTEYNKDYRYKMILSTTGTAPILHADPALDITAEILAGLNAQYAAEQKK